MKKIVLLLFITHLFYAQQVTKKPTFKDKTANELVSQCKESIATIIELSNSVNSEENKLQIENEIANTNELVLKINEYLEGDNLEQWKVWIINEIESINPKESSDYKEFIEKWKKDKIESIGVKKPLKKFPSIPKYEDFEISKISEIYQGLVLEYVKNKTIKKQDEINNIAVRIINDPQTKKEDIEKWYEWNRELENFYGSKQINLMLFDLTKEYKIIKSNFPKAPIFTLKQLTKLCKNYQEKVSNFYTTTNENLEEKANEIKQLYVKINSLISTEERNKWEHWHDEVFFFFYLQQKTHPIFVNFRATKVGSINE